MWVCCHRQLFPAFICAARESVQRSPARKAAAAPPRIINLITRFSDNDPFRLFPDFSPDIVRDKKGAEKTDLAEVARKEEGSINNLQFPARQ